MKNLRTLVLILALGAVMALIVENFAGTPAAAVNPPPAIIAMSVTSGLPMCVADTNNDHEVNSADLSVLLGQFGSSVPAGTGADFNNDGLVNSADLSVLLAAFGLPCVECGVPGDCAAAPPNMVATCVGGECQYACATGFRDCNANLVDGCEININTNAAHCGDCNQVCNLPNAIEGCAGGVCTIAACNAGFANCDGVTSNGCETNTNTNINNCGNCNVVCNLPNANEICVNGTCVISSCIAPFANCDAITSNGCETNTSTSLTSCGTCNVPCTRPNGTVSCVNGVCTLTGCNSGFANCDGLPNNGCELNLNVESNSCANAENLGSHCGDLQCGFLCPSANSVIFASRQLTGERWYRARAVECANCSATIRHIIRLNVPAGIDYDLYVYSACGTLVGFSDFGTGADEVFTIQSTDSAASDDSFNYWIEVRFFSGTSCNEWILTIEGTDC